MEDSLLISKVESGNQEAFRSLVIRFQDHVYNTCYGYVRNEMTAQDLAQEVFIEVYRSISQFNKKSQLSTWIYRIAVNKCLDHIRYMSREKRSAAEMRLEDAEHYDVKDSDDNPEARLQKAQKLEILWAQIDKLPENQRTALVLCNFEGLSYKEAAEILEVSVSSVESLIFRSKKKLKELLSDYYNELLP